MNGCHAWNMAGFSRTALRAGALAEYERDGTNAKLKNQR